MDVLNQRNEWKNGDTKFKWQRELTDLKPQKRGGLKIQTNTGVGDHQQITREVKKERKKRIDKDF